MMKAIPFMTDDELMELLAKNMNVYFEDYEEIKNTYINSVESLRDMLGKDKFKTISSDFCIG